jgi:carbonic anhydrase
MKHASHTEARTFGRSYAHPVCEVDGPATYLNIASRQEHIQNRRSMGIHRNPNLWQSLPAKAEFEFQEREDVMALDTEVAFLSAQLAKADSQETAHQIHLQRRRVQNQKDKLYLEELKRQREVQQGTQTGSVYEQTLFHYRRRAMPERDLLAQILPTRSTIRSSAGREAMKALETICSQYHPVTYRSGLRPGNDGKCMCGESVDR